MESSTKAIWPGWKTEGKLGSGGFSTVYEISRVLPNGKTERAALKVIPIPQSEGDVDELYSNGYDDAGVAKHLKSHLASIVNEYSLMLELKGNTNVVYCDDIRYVPHKDGIGWDVFIKMELLTPLSRITNLPEDDEGVIRIGCDLCRALMVCEQKKIIHRDIKPQNIFLSSGGDYKLGDFGVAKTLEKTMSGTKTGTYNYMAPEVYHNRPYGASADIYSLGLVLYWLLNKRRLPFLPLPPKAPSAEEAERARRYRFQGKAIPEPIGGSRMLKRIVLKACAYDVGQRYHTAEEMLSDLRALQGTAPDAVQAKPKKNRAVRAVLAAAVVVLALVAYLLAANVLIPNSKYNNAVALMQAAKYSEAITTFEALNGYQDSAQKITECQTAIQEASDSAAYNNAIALMQAGKYNEAITAFEALNGYQDSTQKITMCQAAIKEASDRAAYNNAVGLMQAGKYNEAIAAFEALDGYQDSAEKIRECQAAMSYKEAEILLANGKTAQAAIAFAKLGDYSDARARSFALWDTIAVRETISAGCLHTAGLKSDGTVMAVGDDNGTGQCDVSDWRDIVAVSAGIWHTVGLKADGTVVAVDDNNYGQCSVSDWRDIVAVSAGDVHTVGLKADGTVVAVGNNDTGECNVSGWRDIVAVSAGSRHTVGLKADGTVVAVGYNDDGACNVSGWHDIVAVSAGIWHTVGLKADGTVVAVGENHNGQCNVSDWRDIVAVSAGAEHTVGLKADGIVVAVDDNDFGQCDVSGWRDIVAVSAGTWHTVGLKTDGTVVATKIAQSELDFGQCNVSDWRNIRTP